MRKRVSSAGVLSFVLLIDGLIAIGFGLASWFAPRATFGTIVDLSAVAEGSLMLALLASLSTTYVVIGLVCSIAAFIPARYRHRFAMLMAASHLWTGLTGCRDIGEVWLVGDPWPDLVIHSAFVCAYLVLVFMVWRRTSSIEALPSA